MASYPDRPTRELWATSAVLVAGVVWYLAYVTVGGGSEAVSYTFLPIGAFFAVVAVWRLCRQVPLDPPALRFWRFILLAFVLITAGYGWLAVDMLAHWSSVAGRTMPLGSAALVGLGFAVAMWGVARVPIGVPPAGERWRLLLDRTIAFLGCATILWHFGLAPMFTATERWSTQAMVLVGLAFLLSIGGVTKVAYLSAGPVDRVALRMIAAIGLTAAAVAVLAVQFGYEGGAPSQAIVMPVAGVLAASAVRAQWGSPRVAHTPRRRDSKMLPYLAIAAVALPLIGLALGPLAWSARTVIFAAVLVSGLISTRQYIFFRDNARLLREKRLSEERLRHEVTHDGLTGLANRALFRSELARALASDDYITILLIDLDDFKTVNDSLGHDGLAVRLGGDEFSVLLTGDDAPTGETVARRLLQALSRPIGADQLLVQASIGIATAERGATLDTVLRHSDVAMYAAKQRGKAGYVRYVPGMEEPVLAHIQLGGELRRALDEEQFLIHYQPVIGLTDGRIIGVEALVRWQHPARGLVPPYDFIPAAERTGLIAPLGRWVLREACRQTAAWLAEFGSDALQKTGVNVSARQLHDPDFVADVVAALVESGLDSDRLVLELTESAVLRGQQVSRTLHELDAMGVKLALDDFGTGESSLSLLRAFPAAIVKLDKSFVDGIEIDDGDAAAFEARQAVARAVIQMAGALRLDAVAEGIENAGQADRLRELGYTLGQGYHLGRPMPAEDLRRLLAAQPSMAAAPL